MTVCGRHLWWRGVVALCLAAGPFAGGAMADPLFEPVPGPVADHVYSGGWEHFVGGGVSVLDCNDDARPDLVLSGGAGPARLLRNDGAMAFAEMPLPRATRRRGPRR